MEISKKNGNIVFNEESHRYWDVKSNEDYISVTTLIHKFIQPFDEIFWARYKTFESLLGKEFSLYKSSILKTKKITDDLIIESGITIKNFNEAYINLQELWKKTKDDSCARGTKIHLEKENVFYDKEVQDISKYNFGGKINLNGDFVCKQNKFDLSVDRGIFPEFLVHFTTQDGLLKVAGQIDLLIKDGNDIYIIDHKTNKKLNFKSGFDSTTKKNATMLYPINNLMDCNMMHYTMQLSLYAYMLQRINPNFVVKQLMIIHYDHDNNTNYYELSYLKDDVERMLKYYKKITINNKNKAKSKRIEY